MPFRDTVTIKPMNRPLQARSRARAERILEAARLVLERDGLEGFTTTAISREAGVPVGSFYQFYPNRESILFAFYEEYLADMRAAIEAYDTPANRALGWREFVMGLINHMRGAEFSSPYIVQLFLAIEREPSTAELEMQQVELVTDFMVAHLLRLGARGDANMLRQLGHFLYEVNNAVWRLAEKDLPSFDEAKLRDWQMRATLAVLEDVF